MNLDTFKAQAIILSTLCNEYAVEREGCNPQDLPYKPCSVVINSCLDLEGNALVYWLKVEHWESTSYDHWDLVCVNGRTEEEAFEKAIKIARNDFKDSNALHLAKLLNCGGRG